MGLEFTILILNGKNVTKCQQHARKQWTHFVMIGLGIYQIKIMFSKLSGYSD